MPIAGMAAVEEVDLRQSSHPETGVSADVFAEPQVMR